jgi:hypothetical protein
VILRIAEPGARKPKRRDAERHGRADAACARPHRSPTAALSRSEASGGPAKASLRPAVAAALAAGMSAALDRRLRRSLGRRGPARRVAHLIEPWALKSAEITSSAADPMATTSPKRTIPASALINRESKGERDRL